MPTPPTKLLAPSVERQLHEYEGLGHLRVSARGDVLTIESGPKTDPVRHARLRRETVSLWSLEMATHSGRWEPTPLRDTKDRLVVALVEQFGWVLTPQDDTPWEPGAN
jgi:hypothetical protein